MIYLASDHGGFNLKEHIKNYLTGLGKNYLDLGPGTLDPADDYPDFAKMVAEKVSAAPDQDLGILFCRSGQGVNIVANKFPHVRATLVWNTKEAQTSRNDDFANILSIPADYISEQEAEDVVNVWLETGPSTDERHIRRIKKITDIESKVFKV